MAKARRINWRAVSACAVALHVPVAAVLIAPPNANAQQSSTTLAPVVVTATRSPQSAVNLVSDIDSASTTSLRERGAVNLIDGLGMFTGISTTSNGAPASTGALFLRGASAGQTLTLIDGFRVSSASLGQPTYELLPLNLTDKVEVLRGPSSGLYGADALGGVVQLFTPRPIVGRRYSGELALGSRSSRRVLGGVSGGSQALSGSIRVNREQSDGYNVTRPGSTAFNADKDGYTRDGIVANVKARLSATTDATVLFLRNELETDYDDAAFVRARTLAKTELSGLTIEHLMPDQTLLEVKLGRSTDRSESVSSFPGVFETTQDQILISGRRSMSKTVQMMLSYERLKQDVATTSYAPNVAAARTTNSFGVSINGREGPHIVQLSVRRDKSNQYDDQTNTTFSYGYVTASGVRWGGAYASGFRAPGFNDLYFPNYGRATIKPEKSRNLELGLYLDKRTKGNPDGWHGKLVAYRNKVTDLIVFSAVCPDPDPQFAIGCADNVNSARLSGLSMSLARRHGAFGWRVNADLANPVDRTLNKLLPRRAKRQIRVGIDYRVSRYAFAADIKAESERFDDAANTNRLGGYTTLNLAANMSFGLRWSGFLTVTNATDKDYSTAAGFRPQGRLIMLGVRYRP